MNQKNIIMEEKNVHATRSSVSIMPVPNTDKSAIMGWLLCGASVLMLTITMIIGATCTSCAPNYLTIWLLDFLTFLNPADYFLPVRCRKISNTVWRQRSTRPSPHPLYGKSATLIHRAKFGFLALNKVIHIIYMHESIIMPSAVFIRVFCARGLTMRDIWNLEIPPRATALQTFKTYLKSIWN